MKKLYPFLFILIFQNLFSQVTVSKGEGYLKQGIIEDAQGKIIRDEAVLKKYLQDRKLKVEQEHRQMHKAATQTAVEMCTNGGFEQIEKVSGQNYIKNFLHTIGQPPRPTQCQSISNKADAYIPHYTPGITGLM